MVAPCEVWRPEGTSLQLGAATDFFRSTFHYGRDIIEGLTWQVSAWTSLLDRLDAPDQPWRDHELELALNLLGMPAAFAFHPAGRDVAKARYALFSNQWGILHDAMNFNKAFRASGQNIRASSAFHHDIPSRDEALATLRTLCESQIARLEALIPEVAELEALDRDLVHERAILADDAASLLQLRYEGSARRSWHGALRLLRAFQARPDDQLDTTAEEDLPRRNEPNFPDDSTPNPSKPNGNFSQPAESASILPERPSRGSTLVKPSGGRGRRRTSPPPDETPPEEALTPEEKLRNRLRYTLALAMSDPGAPCRPDETGIPAELGVVDPRLGGGGGKGELLNLPANLLQQTLPRGDHAAAEQDDVRVDRVHQAGRADGQVSGGFVHQSQGQGVPRVGRLVDGPGGQGVAVRGLAETRLLAGAEGLGGPFDQGGRRRIGFQMPSLAAGTEPASVHLDDDVAALRAVAVPTLDDPAPLDDPAADPRAEREHDEALGAPPGPRPVFAISGGVGVVLKNRRLVQRSGEAVADREILPPRQVRRVQQNPGVNVHRAGGTEAHRRDGVPPQTARRHGLPARFGQRFDPPLRTPLGARLDADRRHGSSVVVHHAAFHVRPPQVDPQVKWRTAPLAAHARPRLVTDRKTRRAKIEYSSDPGVPGSITPSERDSEMPRLHEYGRRRFLASTLATAALGPGTLALSAGPEESTDLDEVQRKAKKAGLGPLRIKTGETYTAIGDAPERFLDDARNLCESLARDYLAHFRARGFAVHPPEHRLVLVVLSGPEAYTAYEGIQPDQAVGGHYDPATNRLVIFDNRARADGGPLVARANTVSLMHEGTHQLSYNTGLLRKGADLPLAIAEGLAMYGEVRGPRGKPAFGDRNLPRLDVLREEPSWPTAAELLTSDAALDDPAREQAAYAVSWLLVYALMQKTSGRVDSFRSYLQIHRDEAKRLEDAREAFGDLAALDGVLVRSARSLLRA